MSGKVTPVATDSDINTERQTLDLFVEMFFSCNLHFAGLDLLRLKLGPVSDGR